MYIIALIGIGLFVHGFILMTITAFKVNKQWGFAVMLVPFAQVFFPAYHWEKSKSSFSSFILGLSLWMGTAIIFGEGALDEYWLDSVDQVQSAETSANKLKFSPKSIEQRSKKFHNAQVFALKPGRVVKHKYYKPVSIDKLDRYTGKLIKIKLHNDIKRMGYLSDVSSESIEIHSYLGNGELSYKVSLNRINSISVEVQR